MCRKFLAESMYSLKKGEMSLRLSQNINQAKFKFRPIRKSSVLKFRLIFTCRHNKKRTL